MFPALCNISTSLSVTFSSPSSEIMSLSRNLRMSVSLYSFVRRKTVREVNTVVLSKIRVNAARYSFINDRKRSVESIPLSGNSCCM